MTTGRINQVRFAKRAEQLADAAEYAARVVNDTGLIKERNESRKTELTATENRSCGLVICSTWECHSLKRLPKAAGLTR